MIGLPRLRLLEGRLESFYRAIEEAFYQSFRSALSAPLHRSLCKNRERFFAASHTTRRRRRHEAPLRAQILCRREKLRICLSASCAVRYLTAVSSLSRYVSCELGIWGRFDGVPWVSLLSSEGLQCFWELVQRGRSPQPSTCRHLLKRSEPLATLHSLRA